MQTRTDDEIVADVGEAERGLVIERRFTTAGSDPFDAFEWIEMSVETVSYTHLTLPTKA